MGFVLYFEVKKKTQKKPSKFQSPMTTTKVTCSFTCIQICWVEEVFQSSCLIFIGIASTLAVRETNIAPWKLMIGRLLFFWKGLFSDIFRCELLVLGRVTPRIDRFRPKWPGEDSHRRYHALVTSITEERRGDDVQEQHVTRWWFQILLIGQVKRYFA